jgi:two-component system LytT family response regulator
MIRVLIADDEPVAADRLELALKCIPDAETVGIATTGNEALRMIRERRPDVAFLDIQMPGQSGLGVMASLKSSAHVPEVVFVTAYDSHAIKAFEMNAVDYLLKPVPFERLREAFRKARERISFRGADLRFAELQKIIASLALEDGKQSDQHFENSIWIKQKNAVSRVATADVESFEAAGDYVIAHIGQEAHFLSDSISGLQKRLNPITSLRVHRSTIVNLQKVRSVRRRGPRAMALIMQSGKQIAIGPSYLDQVLKAMNLKRWKS